jgi:hypothetical protein
MLYYCKGGTVVLGVHADEQLTIVDRTNYGATGVYLIIDLKGPVPTPDPNTGIYPYPTFARTMLADSVKSEANYRINQKISNNGQANMNGYVSNLNSLALGGTALTPAQQTDLQTATQINGWIGRPSGMLGTADALIAANDQQYYLDGKWPPWNTAWNSFVARF